MASLTGTILAAHLLNWQWFEFTNTMLTYSVLFSSTVSSLSLSLSFILSFKYVFTLHNRQIALRGKISKWQLGKFIGILP